MSVKQLPCSICRLPFARIENGVLIIESRHHGDKHTNVISLKTLLELISASDYETREATKEKGFRGYED